MPIPLLVMLAWIAAAVGAGVITVAAAWALQRWLKMNRTVALIGQSGSGKSTLLHVLEHGDVPKSNLDRTIAQETTRVQIENMSVYVVDSGGDRLTQWQRGVAQAKGVIYFFDASLVAIRDPHAMSALSADAAQIGELLTGGLVERKYTLVGTHSDLFNSAQDEQAVRESRVLQKLRVACGGVSDDDVIIGSLANKKAAIRLAAQIAKHQMG